MAADVNHGRSVIGFLEERRVGIIVPGEGADAVLAELLDFRIRVYVWPLLGDRLDDASIEAGGAQVSRPGAPGVRERAEAAKQGLITHTADTGDAVERCPVLELFGRGCCVGFAFGCHSGGNISIAHGSSLKGGVALISELFA